MLDHKSYENMSGNNLNGKDKLDKRQFNVGQKVNVRVWKEDGTCVNVDGKVTGINNLSDKIISSLEVEIDKPLGYKNSNKIVTGLKNVNAVSPEGTVENNNSEVFGFEVKGYPGSSGIATGRLALSPEQAIEWSNQGDNVILSIKGSYIPDNISELIKNIAGIMLIVINNDIAQALRGANKPCVMGCEGLDLLIGTREISIKATGFKKKEGQMITINGFTGQVVL